MRGRLSVFLIVLVALIFGFLIARQLILSRGIPREKFAPKKIRVLTYSYFNSPSGPGPAIFGRFKKEHGCEVEVQAVSDAGLILERLRIAELKNPFDVVIGIDQFQLPAARAQTEWRPVAVDRSQWRDEANDPGTAPFVPIDWSPMSFVYRKGEIGPPIKFRDLLDPRFNKKIALQNPRASSPGLQFLNWVKSIEGENTVRFLSELKPNVQSVSPSWAFSYGLFKNQQVSLVFSYLSSLAFHWGVERDQQYQVVSFPEGHPLQVEYASVPKNCRECGLGEDLVRTLLEPWAQKLILEKNFMFPVLRGAESGTMMDHLPALKIRPIDSSAGRDFKEWDQVFQN